MLLLGATGVGESHLAQALGHRAVRKGHTVLYTSTPQMFAPLRAARGDGSFDRRLLRFTSPDLLIVDDLGLMPLRRVYPKWERTGAAAPFPGWRPTTPLSSVQVEKWHVVAG